jgi:hypothetical protein
MRQLASGADVSACRHRMSMNGFSASTDEVRWKSERARLASE